MNEEGFTDDAPETLLKHSWIYPALIPVWVSFQRLSRGRPYSMMGGALPIPYRDLADELQRCPWPDKEQLERWLIALDDTLLEHAAKQQEMDDGRAVR